MRALDGEGNDFGQEIAGRLEDAGAVDHFGTLYLGPGPRMSRKPPTDGLKLDIGGPVPEGHPASPHRWKLTPGGKVDTFALEWEDEFYGHNGPACAECDLTFCTHCHPEWWATACPFDWDAE